MAFLFDVFNCRPDNPQLARLIQEYPHINARSLVRSDIKRKDLTPGDIQGLRNRVRDEADLREELGEERYQSLLGRFSLLYSTLTGPNGLAANHDYFPYFVRKNLNDPSVDVTELNPKQRVLQFFWHQNRKDFRRQLFQNIGEEYEMVRVDFILERCFPRFVEGRVAIQSEDWGDIQSVLYNDKRRGPRTLSDRFAFAHYLDGWRSIDLLAQEKDFAQLVHAETAIRSLNQEIAARKALLQGGSVYDKEVREANPDFVVRHPALEAQMAQALEKPLDWNAYLNLADQVETAGNANLLAVLRQMEKGVRGRALGNFLKEAQRQRDTGEKRRKYDLKEGCEVAARLCSGFRNWKVALETFKQNTEPPEIQGDFRWFREQADRILRPLREFISTLPVAEEEERFIEQCLDRFSSPFYRSLPTLVHELQLSQTKKLVSAKAELIGKYKNHQLLPSFEFVLSMANSIGIKVVDEMKELFWALSRPSALQPKILRAYEAMKQVSYDMEKLHAKQERFLTEFAKARFYPTIK